MTSFFSPVSSRRQWLRTTACGFGSLALADILAGERAHASDTLPKPHHTPKAKRMIFVFLQGSPSQVDTFDYKPRLQKDNGNLVSPGSGNPHKYLGSPWKFSQYGQAGHWISELYPHVAKHADKLCFLKSLTTDIPNHPQAVLQMHTGAFRFARPSFGSWLLYGLGTENKELPGFLVLNPLIRVGGAQNYGNAFLPARYQAARIGTEGQSIAKASLGYVRNPQWDGGEQRRQLDLLADLEKSRSGQTSNDADLEGVIQSYELGFRMQGSLPKLFDLSTESQTTLDQYGVGKEATDDFGRQCLLARRAVESGVRFVEVTSTGWDHHRNLRRDMVRGTTAVDQPVGALLGDLEKRGLLKDTLVLFGGEFGRQPIGQSDDGRDHQVDGFTMWMAGAGVKPGFTYGATDEFGQKVAENKIHIHDLNATLLHLLGLDHEKLTYRYSGRDFRLTDVFGKVIDEIIA
ncbi:DUF1501 domain-containing protein [Fimbriiglobus ruber]|uniref:Sulfatase n=1 Tax=Fimbriiglobus ruber TaxID=1908690 RepID=A0A225DFD6_9BACT|nr:DUF1501 domain-containing protein [Fimbriiglobus ruber]OWK40192.1 hypothetical protein FRUB_05111 [Fimbriiglobus ruber]